jgi:hypothetical protein
VTIWRADASATARSVDDPPVRTVIFMVPQLARSVALRQG